MLFVSLIFPKSWPWNFGLMFPASAGTSSRPSKGPAAAKKCTPCPPHAQACGVPLVPTRVNHFGGRIYVRLFCEHGETSTLNRVSPMRLLGGLRGYRECSRPVPGLPYRPRNVVLWEAALEGAQNYKPLRAWYGHFQPCKHPTISLIIC